MTLPGLEQLAAKTRVAIEATDPVAILLADHEWLRDVLEVYRAQIQRGEDLAEVHGAVRELKPRLDLHIRREEEAFFPAIETYMQESGRGSTFDMYGEHDAIRIRMDELLIALDQNVSTNAVFGAFARSILIHFENEEELIFAEAPEHLSRESRREILDKFTALAV
jgi:hemerythrin-like domain-containing protein